MRRDIGDCENSVHLNGWQSKAWALQTITKQQPKPQDFIKSQKKSSQSEDSLVVVLLFELNRRVPNGMPGGVREATS